MKLTTDTHWTISKNGASIELTIYDIQQLLDHLAWLDRVIVFDEASGRCGCCIDDICILRNGDAVQTTLLTEEIE